MGEAVGSKARSVWHCGLRAREEEHGGDMVAAAEGEASGLELVSVTGMNVTKKELQASHGYVSPLFENSSDDEVIKVVRILVDKSEQKATF